MNIKRLHRSLYGFYIRKQQQHITVLRYIYFDLVVTLDSNVFEFNKAIHNIIAFLLVHSKIHYLRLTPVT